MEESPECAPGERSVDHLRGLHHYEECDCARKEVVDYREKTGNNQDLTHGEK